MKKVLIALLSVLSINLFAEENILTFSKRFLNDPDDQKLNINIDNVCGFKSGTIGEYVFLKPETLISATDTGALPDDELSYLEWQIKNEFYVGLKINADYKKLFASLDFTYGFPQNSGITMDSDWKNIAKDGDFIPIATQEQQAFQTNYSEHDNEINYDFDINFKAGYSIALTKYLKFEPFLGIDYSKIYFSAYDGWIQYGRRITNRNSDYYEQYTTVGQTKQSGLVLEYTREQTIVWLGGNIKLDFGSDFSLKLAGSLAPYVYTFNIDEHPGKSSTFADICDDSFCAYNLSFEVQARIRTGIYLTFMANYFNLNTIKGESYVKSSSNSWSKLPGQEGGADAEYWTVTFGVKIFVL